MTRDPKAVGEAIAALRDKRAAIVDAIAALERLVGSDQDRDEPVRRAAHRPPVRKGSRKLRCRS